jgi:type II secretory pathway component GspD/PulD (secretin)
MIVAAVSSPKAREEVLMRVASFAVALVVTASVSLAGQPVLKSPPVSFRIENAPLSEVLDLVGKIAELDIQIDDAVPQEVLDRKIPNVVFRNADLEDVLKFLTKYNGLEVEIVDEDSIYVRVRQ